MLSDVDFPPTKEEKREREREKKNNPHTKTMRNTPTERATFLGFSSLVGVVLFVWGTFFGHRCTSPHANETLNLLRIALI
jgi:hypothetical protein